jgi:hypothetical protein
MLNIILTKNIKLKNTITKMNNLFINYTKNLGNLNA